jgi:predicted acylesterase/phospholipase RssA
VGLTVNEMIEEAPTFRGHHIVMHGLTLRAHPKLKPYLRRFCGVIPERLRQLEAGRFDILHHGVERLGVVCHDLNRNQPCYFSTADDHGAPLAVVVRASAAVPRVLPSRTLTLGQRELRLADGGISDSLPIAFAQSAELGATHLIVSDCRQIVSSRPPEVDNIVYIRPALEGVRPLRAPRLMNAVWRGEAAVTAEILHRIQGWLSRQAVLSQAATG